MSTSKSLFSGPCDPRIGSPLFSALPAEVRRLIWEYALTDFPDPSDSAQYDPSSYYARPGYEAPRKSDTGLLQTCRAIYLECWTRPLLLREWTFWLQKHDRQPPEYIHYKTLKKLEEWAERIFWEQESIKGQTLGVMDSTLSDQGRSAGPSVVVEAKNVTVFAYSLSVEEGSLGKLLDRLMERVGLHPRVLTLAIRHADWWFWERDRPLQLEAQWLESVSRALSSSTTEFVIELETVPRKKEKLEYVAAQIASKWFFRRKEGRVLFGDKTCRSNKESTWQGSTPYPSSLGMLLERDECAPGKIEYSVIVIPFRLPEAIQQREGEVNHELENSGYELGRMEITAPGTPLRVEHYIPMEF